MARGRRPAHISSASWFHAAALVYILAASCCRAALVVIGDFSPRIQYNTPVLPDTACKFQRGNQACDGNWWFEHDDSRGPYENHTVHTTYGPGTTATLEFTGTSVALYGIMLEQYGAHALVTLDGAQSSFDCNTTGLPDGVTLLTKQQLFSKAELDPSVSHKLIVAYDDSTFDPTDRAWLSIDYFEIDEQPLVTHTSSTTAAPTGVTSGLPSGSSTTVLMSDTFSQSSGASGLPSSPSAAGVTPSSSAGPSARSALPTIGVIVGGVLGGLAALLFGVFITLLIRRRQNGALSDASSPEFLATTTPYIVSPARELRTATSYAPSSIADTSSLVPPPYTPGEGLAALLPPSNSAGAPAQGT